MCARIIKQDKWSICRFWCHNKIDSLKMSPASSTLYIMQNIYMRERLLIQIMNNDTFVFDCLQACIALLSLINSPEVLE